jgi:sugar lactone lactonase YvrE
VARAPDGTLYVADTGNHRIQHLAANGTVLDTWGSFASLDQGEAPGGTFNEPWGIAVAPDGTVYVADTWNHRIQHFAADGRFLGMWGTFGQAETQTAFWGHRDVAVDATGRV